LFPKGNILEFLLGGKDLKPLLGPIIPISLVPNLLLLEGSSFKELGKVRLIPQKGL